MDSQGGELQCAVEETDWIITGLGISVIMTNAACFIHYIRVLEVPENRRLFQLVLAACTTL